MPTSERDQNADSGERQGRPTLAHLLATLGSDVLQPVSTPLGREVLVGEPVIHGVGEPLPDEQQHAVLLLVGGKPEDPQTASTIRSASLAGYCAVVVKARGQEILELIRQAEAAQVSLLVTPDDVPWRHLDSILTAAVPATAPSLHYSSVGLGDLFALANAIASTVGGAITIEDPHGHVLAYSNLSHQRIDEVRRLAILGRQTPERPQNLDEYRQVFQAEGTVHLPATEGCDGLDRRAIAVRAGTQGLGVIFALEGETPLGRGAEVALQDAAKITALHLLRARSHRDPARWNRAEALRLLLDGTTPARVAAAQLEITHNTTFELLAVNQLTNESMPATASARIVDIVSLYCESWHSTALCTTGAGVVYALLPIRSGGKDVRRILKWANDLVDTIKSSAQLDVQIAVGSTAYHLDELADARRSVDRVLQAIADQYDTKQVATIDDVRSRVAILKVAECAAADKDFFTGPTQQILEHDAQHGTVYRETIQAFLDAFGDARRTAALLSVHENTLRYRLRRVKQLFDINLADPDERLVTWLHLRLLQHRATHGPTNTCTTHHC